MFPVCCSLLRFGFVAVNAHRGYKRCRLTGRVKVDVKAQSHSKLYNRAEKSTWQSHWWDGEEREQEPAKKKEKKKASICVCLPAALYIQNAAHELLVDWQNEVLAIKMVIFFLHPYYSSFYKENHRHTKMLYGKINNSWWALQCCHALCSSHRPRRRQCATTAMKPSYLRHSTGNNLKQLLLFFPVCIPSLLPTVPRVEGIMHHLRREPVAA